MGVGIGTSGRIGAGVACLALACAACGDAAGPEGPELLPEVFRIVGDAAATETVEGTELSADCHLDLIVDLTIPAPGHAEPGRFGGEVRRRVLRPDGSGLGLIADVAGAVRARYPTPDSVELYFPDNDGESGSRFWDELAVLGGRLGAFGEASGDWTCAPFDLDRGDFVDDDVTASGTWRLERREG